MGQKRIVIDSYRMMRYDDDVDALIVRHATGIYYSDQCGGILCTHPEFEGYALWVNTPRDNYENVTHEHLCGLTYRQDRHDGFMQAAKELTGYLESISECNGLELSFDYENISDMEEGCIPVLISGKWEQFDGIEYHNAPAILFTGNCD